MAFEKFEQIYDEEATFSAAVTKFEEDLAVAVDVTTSILKEASLETRVRFHRRLANRLRELGGMVDGAIDDQLRSNEG